MKRRLLKSLHYLRRVQAERGQSLAIFALTIFVLCGAVAMSVDVGRLVWARTQMQAAVDAAALAAAQSMPNQTDAEQKANDYWLDNSGFIQSQGENVVFDVTYPPGNKAIRVSASAEIPTFFARLFGVDHWNVGASGDAESQVLDIAVVLDISGSMCWDNWLDVENNSAWIGPGNPTVHLTQAIPSSSSSPTWIYVDNASVFKSSSSSFNNNTFGYNSSTPYYNYSLGGRKGTLMIGNEIFTIRNGSSYVDTANNRIQVYRAQNNDFLNTSTSQAAHPVGAEVWANRTDCQYAAYSPSTGPYMPYDGMVSAADYFTTLFNASYDKIGLAEYSTTGSLESNLTSSFTAVRSDIDNMDPPGGSTNIAHGIALGRQILDGTGKRSNAVRVLVLLTDGVANYYCGSSTYSSSAYNGTGCSAHSNVNTAINHALAEAQRAADGDIIIFTIGLGAGADQSFMEDVRRHRRRELLLLAIVSRAGRGLPGHRGADAHRPGQVRPAAPTTLKGRRASGVAAFLRPEKRPSRPIFIRSLHTTDLWDDHHPADSARGGVSRGTFNPSFRQ